MICQLLFCPQMQKTPQPLGSDSFHFMLHFKQIKQQKGENPLPALAGGHFSSKNQEDS